MAELRSMKDIDDVMEDLPHGMLEHHVLLPEVKSAEFQLQVPTF